MIVIIHICVPSKVATTALLSVTVFLVFTTTITTTPLSSFFYHPYWCKPLHLLYHILIAPFNTLALLFAVPRCSHFPSNCVCVCLSMEFPCWVVFFPFQFVCLALFILALFSVLLLHHCIIAPSFLGLHCSTQLHLSLSLPGFSQVSLFFALIFYHSYPNITPASIMANL